MRTNGCATRCYNGLTPAGIAQHLGVDPKTAERWVTQDRAPYPKYRNAIAAQLRENETYLWPEAVPTERANHVTQSEVGDLSAPRDRPKRHLGAPHRQAKTALASSPTRGCSSRSSTPSCHELQEKAKAGPRSKSCSATLRDKSRPARP